MYNDSPVFLEPGANHGMPARTPASAALWAHLLRKDPLPPAPDSGAPLPPITPLDKNGTSMRILLHDTQAHLDKFSVQAVGLCKSVETTKQEISLVHSLFQREHETLATEIVDLVNRSQTQIQAAIGSPAQTEEVGRICNDLSNRLESLDKRIDAIQSFNQTHSQMLQLQSQVLQSLQDQQTKVIAAVIPLLPLLQALPLHIESARNVITDLIKKPPTSPLRPHANLHSDNRRRSHKRSNSNPIPDRSPSLPSKKARIIAELGSSGGLTPFHESDTNGKSLDTLPNPQYAAVPSYTLIDPLSASRSEISSEPIVEFARSINSEESTEKSTPSRPRVVTSAQKTTITTDHSTERRIDKDNTQSPISAALPDRTQESNPDTAVVEPVSQTVKVNDHSSGRLEDSPLPSVARSTSIARTLLSSPSFGPSAASTVTSLVPCVYAQGSLASFQRTPKKQPYQPLKTSTSKDTARLSVKVSSMKRPALQDKNAPATDRQPHNEPLVIFQPPSRALLYPGNKDSAAKSTSQPRGPQPRTQESLQSSHPYSAMVAKQISMRTPRRGLEMTPTINNRERPLHVQREGRRFIPLSDSDDDDDGCDGNGGGAASYGA